MIPENLELIKQYFIEQKRKKAVEKWQWLLSRGMTGHFLFTRITSVKRFERFAEFYLNLKKVDWELLPSNIKGDVLDIACHIPVDGFWISRLKDVKKVTLVDVIPPAGLPLEKVQFIKSDATRLPFADHSFDLVMSFSSIEHLTDRKGQSQWIKEMTRVVRPGGTVSVTVDNALSVVNGFPFYWLFKNRQMLPLFWKTLERMIRESGNVKIQKRSSYGIYLYTSWLRPWAESLPSYWLEKLLRPLNGRFPDIEARIGFRYIKNTK